MLMAPVQQAVIGSILTNARDMPPEARQALEGLIATRLALPLSRRFHLPVLRRGHLRRHRRRAGRDVLSQGRPAGTRRHAMCRRSRWLRRPSRCARRSRIARRRLRGRRAASPAGRTAGRGLGSLSDDFRADAPSTISDLLQEDRRFPPSDSFRAQANAGTEDVYARAERDPEGFWEGFARELEWFTPWTQVLDWKPPHAKWFVGGTLNASVNCVDRHVRGPRRNKAAIIWEGEPGDRRTLTYFDLYRQVSQFANVLEVAGREARRPRGHLPAARARAGDRDAGLRAHRRRALGGLRRLQLGIAARSHQRRAGDAAHHGRRRVAPRPGGAAEADGRRRARRHAVDHRT